MKTHPKESLPSAKNLVNSEKEGLKRTKTFNPKRSELPPRPGENKEGYSNSFCFEKKTPEEKINNLKEELNVKQNELYEALAAEFKLKESMMGLEKHAMKLQLENKILQKNRRQSINTLNVLESIMTELNNLKQENSTLAQQSKQVREGAIDAIIEKEKKIMELSEELLNTEQYYKSQLELAREEIKMLQGNMDIKNVLSLEKQRTKELEINLESERKELLKRIEILEQALEDKEKEHKINIVNLEKQLREDSEQKINDQVKIMIERDERLQHSINILETTEEKSNYYQIACINLTQELKSMQMDKNKEISEINFKFEQALAAQNEKMQQIKLDYEKKIEDLKIQSQKALEEKNKYIIHQEKRIDGYLNRISELEHDNKRKLSENSKLLDNIHTLTQQNLNVQYKLEEVASKQDEYIRDLKQKFDSERQLLTFELKHIKKLTMDDSSIATSKIKARKSSFDGTRKKKKDEKRCSIALRSAAGKPHLGHHTSLDIEIPLKTEFFNFKNTSDDSQAKNSLPKNEALNQINEDDDIAHELRGANYAFSEDFVCNNTNSKKIISERRFSIPNEPAIDQEGVLKVDETSSESNLSGFSSKICYDKSIQCNRDLDSQFDPNRTTNSKDLGGKDMFAPDYDLCNEKKANQNQKVEVNREKFTERGSKVSLKNDSKLFFLMEDDSDENSPNRKGKLEKDSTGSIKFLKAKSEKIQNSDEKNSRQFYFEDVEKKLIGITNLVSDFLRNFKETNQNGVVFDSSKKQKFSKIHGTLSDILKKINRDHYVILHELLKKTMIKLDEQTLKTLNYHKLLCLIFEGYTKKNEGFIEYNINLEDVLMKKSWKFQIRYSKLRNFHKECQSFLNSIKLEEGEKGCLPPFPPKKWFGNTEDDFLKTRQKDLESYFQTIMTSPLCQQIIDKGILRYFLYREIWKFESEEFKRKSEQVEKWEVINQKSLIQSNSKNNNNNEENINYETLAQLIREEAVKITAKLDVVKGDLDSLEKNDSFSILKYEEKRKKLEKELSRGESLLGENEFNDIKGLLMT